MVRHTVKMGSGRCKANVGRLSSVARVKGAMFRKA